jgi:NurA-like 5'-3' nuclease
MIAEKMMKGIAPTIMWLQSKGGHMKARILKTFMFDGVLFCIHHRYPIKPGSVNFAVSEYTTGMGISIGSTEAYRSVWDAQQKTTEYLNSKRHLLHDAVKRNKVLNKLY